MRLLALKPRLRGALGENFSSHVVYQVFFPQYVHEDKQGEEVWGGNGLFVI